MTSSSDAVMRRFLLLTVLRWLPTGLMVPVVVLLMTQRGLSLAEVGVVSAVQGVVIMMLELPTGGLADAVGRRRVLLAGTGVELLALVVFVLADGMLPFAIAWGLFGIYRALESGPLESWYVDAAQRADAAADIELGLARRGTVLGLAIAGGSLAASGLVALGDGGVPLGVDPLVVPLLVAIALRLVDLASVWRLMDEPDMSTGSWRDGLALGEVRRVVVDAVGIVRSDRVLLSIVAVELLWGAGMIAFETLTPVQLAALQGSADVGASTYGTASAAGWLVSAGAAAMVPLIVARSGPWMAAAWMRIAQGATVLGIGLAAGPIAAVVSFVLTMGVHGGANAVHSGLLHRTVDGPRHRATIVSVNSLVASVGGAVGAVVLGAVADVDLTVAFVVGAALLAAGAPLYLAARKASPGTTHGTVTRSPESTRP